MKRFIISEEEKRHIKKMYLLEDVGSPMKIGGGTPSSRNEEQFKDMDGFYVITYSYDSNIKSVQNFYNGGKSMSERHDFLYNEKLLTPQNQYIAFTYWFNNKAGNTMNIILNVKSSDGSTVTESWSNRGPDSTDSKYMGRFYVGPLPNNSTITISVEGDKSNSLLITTKESSNLSTNCDEEWKVVYKNLEDTAEEKSTSIDIRPFYCGKDHTNYIKGIYPSIDDSKLECLKNKIKKQYC